MDKERKKERKKTMKMCDKQELGVYKSSAFQRFSNLVWLNLLKEGGLCEKEET